MVDVVDEESYCKADANQILRSWLHKAKVSTILFAQPILTRQQTLLSAEPR